MNRGLALVALMTGTASAGREVVAVHTYTGETRACAPLDNGQFLVGTGGGLVHLDRAGVQLGVLTALSGLPGTRIDGIARVDGGWWVGTELGAAKLVPDGAGYDIARVLPMKVSVRDAIVFGGATYLATEAGVIRLGAGDKQTTLRFTGGGNAKTRARVSSLAVADGALWAGTAGGLFKLTNGTLSLVTIEAGANEVTSLYGDGATLWIATTAGLFAREGATVRSYFGGDLRRVTKVDGAIVAAGLGDRVSTVERGRLVDASFPDKLRMTQAIAAHGGAACAGGLDALWLRPANKPWLEVARPAGIPANDVSALAADGDTLWVGMFDHGVAKLRHGVWTRIEDAALDHRVNALLVEPRAGKASRVWVATASGISIIDGANVSQLTKRDGLPARGVLSLARMRDGRILAGTMHGAAIIGNGRPIAIGLKQNLEVKNIWAVAEDSEGYLWLGATTGVYRGKADDTAWKRYSVATRHLRDDWVMALAHRDGEMFVGTYKGGLTKLAFAGDAVTATQLGAGWINPGGLRWEGDALEAATMEGLRSSDARSRDWLTTFTFTGRDTTATARAGAHWIATRRGLVGMHY